MINIDTVYQKVLVLSNKEQRGYITPQEFNLLSDQAQMEIFNNYFHGIKTNYQSPAKNMEQSHNEIDMIQNKLDYFQRSTSINILTGGEFTIPDITYRVVGLYMGGNSASNPTVSSVGREVQKVRGDELASILNNPLTYPTKTRPIYAVLGNNQFTFNTMVNDYRIYPDMSNETEVFHLRYYIKPRIPNWGYVIVKGKPLYNSSDSYSRNFDLHESEEENLVMRILALAGVVIQKPGIVEVAMSDSARKKQEQNS